MIYFVLSIDTEFDFFQYVTIFSKRQVKREFNTKVNPGIVDGLPKLLGLFEKYEVPATFFIQEQKDKALSISSRFPDVVDRISDLGHEIGLHVHVFEGSLSIRKKEITTGYKRLRQENFNPKSFRAGWYFTNENTIRVLEECKIECDCSPWKNRCSGSVPWFEIPNSPYHPSYKDIRKTGDARVLMMPITDYRLCIDLDFPLALMKKGTEILHFVSQKMETPVFINLTMHPWDFIDPQSSKLKKDRIKKLEDYLCFMSSLEIKKISMIEACQIWKEGKYEPYNLELPDLLWRYMPSIRRHIHLQKYLFSKILNLRYHIGLI